MRFVSFAILLSGCVSPGTAFDQYARQLSINRSVVTGGRFEHAVYEKSASLSNAETLHVYIGSDGTPWLGNRPASDPTPRNPLALRLMSIDPAPAIYIGRPCYHGLAQDPDCNVRVWTSGRYSADTVDSMATVIARYSANNIVLIGYSGGGAIAALLASRLERVQSLITIAANLDTAAWIQTHGYEPLSDSLNPANQPAIPDEITQWHFYGGRDINVPVESGNAFFQAHPTARTVEIPDFDHVCCWEQQWLAILARTLGTAGAIVEIQAQ